jgi:alkylation response protein AidB-like acyl-CoA dehydrogenase
MPSACGNCPVIHDHQIYEGTNQIQRIVMARQLLKG